MNEVSLGNVSGTNTKKGYIQCHAGPESHCFQQGSHKGTFIRRLFHLAVLSGKGMLNMAWFNTGSTRAKNV